MSRSDDSPAIAPETLPRPPAARTLGSLRVAGYRPRSVKQELRENTLARLRAGKPLVEDLIGYEHTVLPQVADALLARHDLLLLGLRGQAKTRILRALTSLLDEWTPVIDHETVDLPDDPMAPRTSAGRAIIASLGDDTPIRWLHRSRRYHEKLATPDVTVADLIGDVDLIKHAQGRALSDEATMHFGLIPRASRGIFAINELPDLAPRIQVALFNVLEERDVQIRGYDVRLNVDVCLVFSANPEDYTNRGRIVTPLKDRIGSVVRTHYPRDLADAARITAENAFLSRSGGGAPAVEVPAIMAEIIEQTVDLARTSPHVSQASGVSVRASIAMAEALVSAAERRALTTGETRATARVCDLSGVASAVRGKMELMLADDSASDQEGRTTEDKLIDAFVGEAVKACVGRRIDLEDVESIAEAFASPGGMRLELGDDVSAEEAIATMRHAKPLLDAARAAGRALGLDPGNPQHLACAGELVLEFLYTHRRISKASRPGRRDGGGPRTGVSYGR